MAKKSIDKPEASANGNDVNNGRDDAERDPLLGLKRNRWPQPEEHERFYGAIEWGIDGEPTERWERRTLLRMPSPFTLRLGWAPEKTTRAFRCSRQVRHSLARILSAIWEHYGHDGAAITAEGMDLFWGCYRPADGATEDGHLTLHAWGAAIQIGGPKTPDFVAQVFDAEGWEVSEGGIFTATS